MKTRSFNKIAMVLSMAMMISTVLGCGEKAPVEEDVVTTISVDASELAPEITDEDLGIVRKDPSELMSITGYQSWEGYNFLVMKNNAEGSETTVTVQIEDEDLFNALYDARLDIYVEPSYSSVDQDDPMYAAYARGLRSLGDEFYNISSNESSSQTDEADTLDESEETTASDEEAIEDILGDEETTEETADEEPEATAEETEATGTDEDDTQSLESLLNGGWADTEEAKAEKQAREELSKAIEEYMKSVSLNRATQILVYALDGELLGDMTPAKLNDYVSAFNTAPTHYEAEEGTVYISDLDDGVEYEVEGYLSDDAGNCEYMIKNDSKRPVTIYLKSDTTEDEEIIFQNYMPTSQSTGWYLVENQYGFTSTDKTYIVRVEHKNSDADLVSELPESKVLLIEEIGDEAETVNSDYSAIVNNTDYPVYIEADTGDSYILDSKQAIGVHKSAYNSLTYEFEGAGKTESEE